MKLTGLIGNQSMKTVTLHLIKRWISKEDNGIFEEMIMRSIKES